MKKIFAKFDLWVSASLLAGITVLMSYEVIMRYIFHNSSAMLTEIFSLAFIWFIYFSMSHITGIRDHITIAIPDMLFPKSWLKYIILIANLIMLAFMLIMTYGGINLVISVIHFHFRTPVLDILMVWPYSIIPLAFGIQSIKVILLIYEDLQKILHSAPDKKENGYA